MKNTNNPLRMIVSRSPVQEALPNQAVLEREWLKEIQESYACSIVQRAKKTHSSRARASILSLTVLSAARSRACDVYAQTYRGAQRPPRFSCVPVDS